MTKPIEVCAGNLRPGDVVIYEGREAMLIIGTTRLAGDFTMIRMVDETRIWRNDAKIPILCRYE